MMLYIFWYHRNPCTGNIKRILLFTAEKFTDQGKDYYNVYFLDSNMKKTWVTAPSESVFISWVRYWDSKVSVINDTLWVSDAYTIGTESYLVRGSAFSGSWAAEAAEMLCCSEVHND